MSNHPGGYTIHRIGPEEVPVFVGLRSVLFDSFVDEPYDRRAFTENDIAYFSQAIAAGETAVWVAKDSGGQAVACVAATRYRLPPKPWNPSGLYAYLSSMYTDPAHRRRGLASQLMERVEAFALQSGASLLSLHATPAGKPLYTAKGYKETNEMRRPVP